MNPADRAYRPPSQYNRGMPNRSSKPKRPRDPNQLAKLITDIATGEVMPVDPDSGKNAAAVALGRLGGLKGGKARAAKLSRERLSEIGKKGAAARKKSIARSQASSSDQSAVQRQKKPRP